MVHTRRWIFPGRGGHAGLLECLADDGVLRTLFNADTAGRALDRIDDRQIVGDHDGVLRAVFITQFAGRTYQRAEVFGPSAPIVVFAGHQYLLTLGVHGDEMAGTGFDALFAGTTFRRINPGDLLIGDDDGVKRTNTDATG